MAKYLVKWETDTTKIPDDPQARGELFIKMLEATKQALGNGQVSDWGQFVGGGKGYGIAEGDAVDVFKTLQQWAPYVTFKVQEVLSVDEVTKAVKSMVG
ncbi:MAG: DUF3303 family protein [Planctomycetota bacterium]|jgi:hypothetical protein